MITKQLDFGMSPPAFSFTLILVVHGNVHKQQNGFQGLGVWSMTRQSKAGTEEFFLVTFFSSICHGRTDGQTDIQTDGQMDGQKVTPKSPLCMSTGGLKNSCIHLSDHPYNYRL